MVSWSRTSIPPASMIRNTWAPPSCPLHCYIPSLSDPETSSGVGRHPGRFFVALTNKWAMQTPQQKNQQQLNKNGCTSSNSIQQSTTDKNCNSNSNSTIDQYHLPQPTQHIPRQRRTGQHQYRPTSRNHPITFIHPLATTKQSVNFY